MQKLLKPAFSPLAIFALSIGGCIGWGAFVVLTSVYLARAGFLGTVCGLAIGMAIILAIAWNVQYMIQASPDAGGVYTFKKNLSGEDTGFVAFWFVLLVYLALLWGNISAVPIFLHALLGDMLHTGFHYTLYGFEVWFGELAVSFVTVLLIALLCARGQSAAGKAAVAAALMLIIGVAACAVLTLFQHEGLASCEPFFASGSGKLTQITLIAAVSPWAFVGFEAVSHFSKEYDFPIRKIRGILLWTVVISAVLYMMTAWLTVSAYPPEYESWHAYILDLNHQKGLNSLPVFYAASHYLGPAGVAIMLLALFSIILTSLIANMMALSRLLYAAGRQGDVPQCLGRLNAQGVPENAVWAVAAVSTLIPFLGGTAIGWVLDVTTLGAALAYALISHGVYRHAKQNGRRLEQLTGLGGLALSIGIMALLLVPGLMSFHAMQTQSYALFIGWAVLGLAYFAGIIQKKRSRSHDRGVIVWIALLSLMMLSALMWASRKAEIANSSVVAEIMEYHHGASGDVLGETSAQQAAFFMEQAREISSANTLFTLFALILFIIFSGVLLYKNQQRIRSVAEDRRQLIADTERDALTGLYSRKFFYVYANHHRRDNPELPMDAVFIDVSRFHSVNALHGHDFGDEVLRALGAELKRFAQENSGMAGRSDADQFGLYCPHREDWQRQLEHLQASMNSLFPNAHIHLRMGVKPWSREMDPELMFECARLACGMPQGANRSVAIMFSDAMRHKEAHEQRLLNDLGRALRDHEFSVHYQPKYDIQCDPPRLHSAEALIRWRHPELGMISPGEFIPLFEKTGWITQLDEYVWKQAARQIADWRDRLGKTLPVSVNLSRVDVFNPDLLSVLNQIRDENRLQSGQLKLEVTESAYTDDPEQLIQVIKRLQHEGYVIEMDDFGSGYSSLNMLSSMPIDLLKMDIGFIRHIEQSEKDMQLVRVVLDIARHMNVPVVAEGVETEGQLKRLRDAGCALAQGYYFSRPLPAAEFEKQILLRTDPA